MRSSITVLLILLALNVATASSFNVIPAADNVYNVYYKSTETTDVKVTIYDSRNTVVFREVIRSSGFKRPYNFRELPSGEYTIVVSGNDGEQVQKINHNTAKQNTKRIVRVAPMTEGEGKYLVTVANTTTQDVWIRIYHNRKGLIHEEKVTVSGGYAQIYNLKQVQGKSTIRFEIVTANQIETAEF
jgi:hypothetical protein